MKKVLILMISMMFVASMVFMGSSCKAEEAAEEAPAEEAAQEAAAEEAEEEAEEVAEEVEEEVEEEMGGPKYGGVCRVGMQSQPELLDNHLFGTNHVLMLTDPMNDFLYRWNTDYSGLEPHVASSWEWNDEGTELTVTLRDDVMFHNGDMLTSADVKASFERCMDPDNGSGHYGFLTPITEIEIIDDYNLIIKLESFTSGFEEYLVRLAILPKSIIDSDPESLKTSPVGCGPFKFVEWIKDQAVVMERFDDYYVPELPYLDGIEFKFYQESTTMHIALENNELDIINWSDAQQVVDVPERNPDIEPILNPVAGAMYLALNMGKEPFKSNKALRQAIRYATDPRPYGENYAPGTRPVLNQLDSDPRFDDNWNWDESWYDIDKAKQLLADAGYPDGEGLDPIVAVGTIGSEGYMPELFQGQMAAIGVEVEAVTNDIPEAVAKWQNGEYDVATLGDIGTSNPGFMVNKYFIPGGALTWVGFYDYNQDIIDLYNSAISEPDEAARNQAWIDIYDIVTDELPLIYLHTVVTPKLQWNYVRDFISWPDVMEDYTQIWFDK